MISSSNSAISSIAGVSSTTDKTTDETGVSEPVHGEINDTTGAPQVYMSIFWQSGYLGAAYYDCSSSQLYLLPDTEDAKNSLHILNILLRQVQPQFVVVCSKQDHHIIETLKTYSGQRFPLGDDGTATDEDEDAQNNRIHIDILPSIDFNAELCKRRLMHLALPSMPDHYTELERTVHISSLIPMEKTRMIQASGALVKYIEKRRVGVELEEADVTTPILAIHTFSLDNLLVISDNSYCALQIFNTKLHPSAYKKFSGREGLSLYGIMNRCRSKAGSQLLRQWFLQPTRILEVLQDRQDTIAFCLLSHSQEAVTTLEGCLKNIPNISTILSRMTRQEVSVGDLRNLYKMSYNGTHIGDVCRAQSAHTGIFRKISQVFTGELHQVASLINRIVDFEESSAQDRFVVKPNIDADLDEKKRRYNGLPDFMTKVARSELAKLGDEVTECNVIYLPQLGYLLAIPVTAHMKETEDYTIDSLQFMFLSNYMVHYKSASTIELDRMLGDVQCEIKDIETGILHKLQSTILEHTDTLLKVAACSAELDCLLALAACAKEYCYARPVLSDSNVIQIQAGRHPLQERCCSPFVPNDTLSGGNGGKMKILTGPNASGKSVYLKQVALIVFLAHVGSYVPAETATIGLFDHIFTRIRSVQTVSENLSSFMIDLNQVSNAVCCATPRSLVILDEFGKSTAVEDGIALLCSCLTHWLEKGLGCPHVFVSTHFHSIIQQRLLPNSPQLMFQTLEVEKDGEEVVFLYHVIEGHTDSSYACHIAGAAGLPAEIIKRGVEVSDLLGRRQPVHRVDRDCNSAILKRCETIVSQFMDLDEEKDDVIQFLKDFVLPAYNGKSKV